MKGKKSRAVIIYIITAATLCFIWTHSLMPESVSSEESQGVLRFLEPLLELFVGQGNVTNHLVRKLAHFAEFSALGFELYLIFAVHFSDFWKRLVLSLNLGLLAALIDETLQLFSRRGALVGDIWLDFSGVAAGSLFAALILYLINRSKQKRT